MDQDDKPMSVRDAEAFTGYSRSYIYKLISQGKIPCYRPLDGGRVFFNRRELEAFVYRHRQSADYEVSDQADRIIAGLFRR